MEPQRPDHTDPEQKPTLIYYGVFGTGLILSMVPSLQAALAALLLITGVLIAAYIARSNAKNDGLLENHMTFIIRTIWIATMFSMLTTAAGTAYMMQHIDYSPIYTCMEQSLNISQQILMSADTAQLIALGEKIANVCLPDFVNGNMRTFMNATLIAGGPILLYAIYRFVRGLSRATKGYRILKPASWF